MENNSDGSWDDIIQKIKNDDFSDTQELEKFFKDNNEDGKFDKLL